MNNLLQMAHQLIPYQSAQYFQFTGKVKGLNLLETSQYSPPTPVKVKINAVKSGLIKRLGLDYNKNYMRLFSTPAVSGLSRVNDGDQFEFDGRRWQIETQTGWFATAGWDSFVMVDVGVATLVNANNLIGGSIFNKNKFGGGQ